MLNLPRLHPKLPCVHQDSAVLFLAWRDLTAPEYTRRNILPPDTGEILSCESRAGWGVHILHSYPIILLHRATSQQPSSQPLPEQPELVRPSVYYRYADAKYENASDLQKFMWRIGPDNALRLQRYLRELEQAL